MDVAATGACSPSSSLYGVASEAIRGSESSAAGVVEVEGGGGGCDRKSVVVR